MSKNGLPEKIIPLLNNLVEVQTAIVQQHFMLLTIRPFVQLSQMNWEQLINQFENKKAEVLNWNKQQGILNLLVVNDFSLY